MATSNSKINMAAEPIDPTSAIAAAQPGAMSDDAVRLAAAAAQPAPATPPPAVAGFHVHRMTGDGTSPETPVTQRTPTRGTRSRSASAVGLPDRRAPSEAPSAAPGPMPDGATHRRVGPKTPTIRWTLEQKVNDVLGQQDADRDFMRLGPRRRPPLVHQDVWQGPVPLHARQRPPDRGGGAPTCTRARS